MSPARPFHINYPHVYADGTVHEDDRYYEVVGHRDGPVVARFYFYPDDPNSQQEALDCAIALRNVNQREKQHEKPTTESVKHVFEGFDGFTQSAAFVGARSCPYCARFKNEGGHSNECPWRRLVERTT